MTHSHLQPVARHRRPPGRASQKMIALGLLVTCIAVTGCATAYIAIGVVAVGVGAAAIAYDCDEPVSVSIWDPMKSHVVCDAEVTASSGNTQVGFSPCYVTALGEGTWTVTATKSGYAPATGTIVVAHDHRCSQPVTHSLELSLIGAGPPMPPPVYVPAPGPAPTPMPAPVPSQAPPAPAEPAPAPVTPSPTAAPPKAAFPQ